MERGDGNEGDVKTIAKAFGGRSAYTESGVTTRSFGKGNCIDREVLLFGKLEQFLYIER